jgi:hypothetical protein
VQYLMAAAHTIGWFNGSGIYDSQNDLSLDTNTVVLFAFVLAVAVVLSYAYMWMARAFTKQFIWITGALPPHDPPEFWRTCH